MKHVKSMELYEKATGDCYQAAGRLIMKFIGDEEAILVHGMVDGRGALEGVRFGHAWVEYGNKAMDHSNGNKFEVDKRAFYSMGNIKEDECYYYKPGKAAGWMLKKEHWGPWEMSGSPVKLNEDIPDEHEEIGKREIKIKNKDMKNIEKIEDFNESINEASKDWLGKDIVTMQKAHERVLKAVITLEKAVKNIQKVSDKNEGKQNAEMFQKDANDMIKYFNNYILNTDSGFWNAYEEYRKGGRAAFPDNWN